MSAFNGTFVDAINRNMNCPVCGVTQSVPKKINKSAEASRNALRIKIVSHIKSDHPGPRGEKFLTRFGADMLLPSNAPSVGEAQIREIVRTMLDDESSGSGIDGNELRLLVREELRRIPLDNTLTIKHVDAKVPVSIKVYHAMLKEVIRTVECGFKNVLLVGPAGTGKTTMVMQLAKALRRPFGLVSFTSGVTEGTLVGRLSSIGKYLASQFATMFESPGVFLLDEMDRADANVLLILNAALEQGILSTPDGRTLKRHPEFTIVAAGNTWGTGADWQYVGANQLDASTLSRFAGAVIEIGYDAGLERQLTTTEWYDLFIAVRTSCASNKVRRVMGTREMLAGQKLLAGGYTPTEVWARLTSGWTADERRKGGIPNA